MNEITRIHIAKIPYDIEIDAKKELEKYNKQLSTFVDGSDVMDDVEVRITELLAERGVFKGGVVAREDVRAVRAKLGEPHEFAGESVDTESYAGSRRRLYRDTDSAVVGGVLGGVAKFFGVNPLWIRLGFLVLLLVSFGTAAIVYIVLWFVVPPARTAAEKLQLEGRPITLENMKELREQAVEMIDIRRTSEVIKNSIIYGVGVIAVLGALGALAATVVGGFTLGLTPYQPLANELTEPWVFWAVSGLFVASGLLLTALCATVAYACFSRRASKRIGIAVVILIATGIVSFGSGLGVVSYGHWQENARIDAMRQTAKVALPQDFAQIKQLTVSAHAARNSQEQYADFTVEYMVDPGVPRYVLESLPDVKPQIVIDGDHARVVLKPSRLQNIGHGRDAPRLVIYGPALDKVTTEQGNMVYTALYQEQQEGLALQVGSTTSVTTYGSFNNLQVDGNGRVDMSTSAVQHLTIQSSIEGSITAGVVKTLGVTQPDACPARPGEYVSQSGIEVRGVSSGEMTYNGQKMVAKTHEVPCGKVVIGDDDNINDYGG